MEQLTVRYAKREELEQVNHIRWQVNDLHCKGRPDFFKSNAWEDIKDIVYERFEAEESGVVVACMGDEVVGMAVVQYIHREENPFRRAIDFYHVEEFCVDENHRGQHVATALVDFMKEDAAQRGFEKMELDMWEFNESALAFYENVGFGTYRRYMEMKV